MTVAFISDVGEVVGRYKHDVRVAPGASATVQVPGFPATRARGCMVTVLVEPIP